ncbi:DUF134 domain-containing protein [Candidatus Peregrinibacteria bacterium]|nr:DUF134 domain-containing protein [Candidatus Peregrinibacteria bacterium]
MPRPRKRRRVRGRYNEYYFKPSGVRLSSLQQIDLTFDEIEALKYVDLEGLTMDEAAEHLNVSKPTVCRIVNGARKKIADAVINGKAINISQYYLTNKTMPNQDGTGPNGEGPQTGRGMGNCDGAKPNNAKQPLRKGFGRRPGFGRGAGRRGGGRGRR